MIHHCDRCLGRVKLVEFLNRLFFEEPDMDCNDVISFKQLIPGGGQSSGLISMKVGRISFKFFQTMPSSDASPQGLLY